MACALLLFQLRASGQTARVDPEAARILAEQGSVCVLVTLRDTSRTDDPRVLRAEEFSKVESDFLSALPETSIRVRYRFRFSPVIVLNVLDAPSLAAITLAGAVEGMDLDATGSGGLNQSRALIHANEVHAMGIKGAGRIAAVLDSGVDTNHPDLIDAIVHQHHFLNHGADTGPGAEDEHGHGTHVAGIIASRGTVAPLGIAPEAKLIAIRVLDSTNSGAISDWAAGVEYVVGLKESGQFDVDAINMSLVSNKPFSSACDSTFTAFSAACQAAVEAGIAVFAASGNTASASQMTSPACLSSVFSVGSVLDTLPNRISSFTSRDADLDLLAPGATITSTGIGGGTRSLSGTSQACPHAVALSCLLREVSPGMPPAVILAVMQKTGVPVLDSLSGLTFPRIDALAAVNAAKMPGDCNENGISDFIDITMAATSADLNSNGVPDECDSLPPAAKFRRGDANGSGDVDLSDAVKTFNYLFAGGSIDCEDAADSNDSGETDISDGIFTLERLFQGGDPIPAPGPSACGVDPTPDALGCDAYAQCGA